jgi:hypothetical protein
LVRWRQIVVVVILDEFDHPHKISLPLGRPSQDPIEYFPDLALLMQSFPSRGSFPTSPPSRRSIPAT